MQDIDTHVKRYLETEILLNDFFSAWDYCLSQCITVEVIKNGNRPVAACCTKKYYVLYDLEHPAFERLRAEREMLFGTPQDHIWINPVSPCEYHDPKHGCLLVTHKSPICLSFMCKNGIDYLRNRFGIYAYDYLGVHYALEWILTGDFSEKQCREFQASILDMSERVKKQGWRPGQT